jgi:hypothetical protein
LTFHQKPIIVEKEPFPLCCMFNPHLLLHVIKL